MQASCLVSEPAEGRKICASLAQEARRVVPNLVRIMFSRARYGDHSDALWASPRPLAEHLAFFGACPLSHPAVRLASRRRVKLVRRARQGVQGRVQGLRIKSMALLSIVWPPQRSRPPMRSTRRLCSGWNTWLGVGAFPSPRHYAGRSTRPPLSRRRRPSKPPAPWTSCNAVSGWPEWALALGRGGPASSDGQPLLAARGVGFDPARHELSHPGASGRLARGRNASSLAGRRATTWGQRDRVDGIPLRPARCECGGAGIPRSRRSSALFGRGRSARGPPFQRLGSASRNTDGLHGGGRSVGHRWGTRDGESGRLQTPRTVGPEAGTLASQALGSVAALHCPNTCQSPAGVRYQHRPDAFL